MVNHGIYMEEDERMYERAEVKVVTDLAEGVFMASGAQEEAGKCPKFPDSKKLANPGNDSCQVCAATKGQYINDADVPEIWYAGEGRTKKGFYKEDYFNYGGCPYHVPEK